MPVSAHDVADELRRLLPDLTHVKLHELLYYAQGWHLIDCNEPLFVEEIRASAGGPVVTGLCSEGDAVRRPSVPRPLGDGQIITIAYVAERYGGRAAKVFTRFARNDGSERDLGEDSAGPVVDPVVSHEVLRRWFSRDPEYLAFVAAIEKGRAGRNVYGFDPFEMVAGLRSRAAEVHGGPPIVEARSA